MPILRLDNVSLAYGHLPLLSQVDFQVDLGERVCIVGRNGTGKTTFFRVIMGTATADGGEVWRTDTLRIAHLEQEVPPELEIHLIVDNYGTHKSAAVQRWLKPKGRRRFHFHFTPTSSSWLNQVERWFGLITDRMIRRGTFHSVADLVEELKSGKPSDRLDSPVFAAPTPIVIRNGKRHQTDFEHRAKPRPRAPMTR